MLTKNLALFAAVAVTSLLTHKAHATYYTCLFSAEVPNVAYLYQNPDEEDGPGDVTKITTQVAGDQVDPNDNLLDLYLGITHDKTDRKYKAVYDLRSWGFSGNEVIYGPEPSGFKVVLGDNSVLRVDGKNGKTDLMIPDLTNSLRKEETMALKSGQYTFDGKTVSHLYYHDCGQDD